MEVDPEVAFAGEVTAEERTAAEIKQAIDIKDDDFDPRSLPVSVTQPPPPKRARVDNSAVSAPDFDSVASQSSAAASSSSAAVVVKEEKTAEAEAARQSEEAAWELSVWPDADGRKVNAPELAKGRGAHEAAGGATVVSFTEVLRGSDDGGNSNAIAAVEELGCDALRARFGGRVAALNALCSAPKQLVNVRGRVSPLVENGVYTPNSVELRVEVRFASDVVNASLAQRREGFCHAGLDAAIGALLLARQKGGEAIAGLPLKTKGVCVPPRAARLGAASLRTLRGQLKALETEGTAARPPPPPDGLSVNLGEYQVETVGWMLARENSKFGIEDLFETPLGSLAVTALPTPKEFTDKGKHIAEEVKAAARGKAQLSTTASAVSRPRHRGGILAEEMGMGKTIELLALFLSNRPPAGWKDEGNGVARRPETLVVVPNALGGQWDKEIRQRAPGLKAVPFNGGSPPPPAGAAAAAAASSVLICTYNMVSQLPANAEWWRICLDEPHGNLRTTMMKGRIELSPEVVQCAALRGERRWCVTGTPLGNQLIDVYGQLVFLRLASADDSGRAGPLILALHFRLQYAGTWQSEYMSTAEIIASILKPSPCAIRRRSRNGEAFLPPVHHNTVLIPPTDHEAAAYAAARAAAAEVLAAGRHRLHAHAHALRPLTLLCSGVTGKLAEDLETRQSGLTARKTSGAWRVHVKMPKQRDDFRFDATVVHSADLYEWARSINVNREHDCASCLQRVTSLNGQGAVALAPCGHLLCVGCKDALLQTAQGAADCRTRERVGVRIHGPDGCFPDDCYLDGRQNEEGQAARATLRSYLIDRIRGIFPSKPIPQIEINVYYAGGNGNGDSAWVLRRVLHANARARGPSDFVLQRLPSRRHVAHQAAEDRRERRLRPVRSRALRGGGARPAVPHRPNNVALHGGAMPRLTFERATYTVQCAPCPAAGCNHRRFADFEVLDIHQTIEHPERTVWPAVVREFICAYKVRERRALKASRRATRDQPARPPVIAAPVVGVVVVVVGVVVFVVRGDGVGGRFGGGRRCGARRAAGSRVVGGRRLLVLGDDRPLHRAFAHVEAARVDGRTPRGQVRRRRPSEVRLRGRSDAHMGV